MCFLLITCSKQDKAEFAESSEASIPAHIRELENLRVFPDFEPLQSVQFSKQHKFGEIYPQLLSPVRGFGPKVAIDGMGNVFRAEKAEKTILVFDSEGMMKGRVGREGKGPGEFQTITAIDIYDEQLIVYDSNLTRINIFSTQSLELLKTLTIDSKTWDIEEAKMLFPLTILGIGKEEFLTAVSFEKNGDSYNGFYLMDIDGRIISKKITENKSTETHTGDTGRGHRATIRVPYSTRGELDVTQDGKIYQVDTGDFLIKVFNLTGELERSIYYPFEKDPLEEQEVLDRFHPNIHRVLNTAVYPETWPALEHFFVDDKNRIWVSTIVDDKEVHEWHILENSGKLLASFTWPSDQEIITSQNGLMYTEEEDSEAGANVVVSYKIEFGEKQIL
ncbi:MAG: 6-bladed beta-propeller [Balneolaceae bacterium]